VTTTPSGKSAIRVAKASALIRRCYESLVAYRSGNTILISSSRVAAPVLAIDR
jgi:hypothetical protein